MPHWSINLSYDHKIRHHLFSSHFEPIHAGTEASSLGCALRVLNYLKYPLGKEFVYLKTMIWSLLVVVIRNGRPVQSLDYRFLGILWHSAKLASLGRPRSIQLFCSLLVKPNIKQWLMPQVKWFGCATYYLLYKSLMPLLHHCYVITKLPNSIKPSIPREN